jgi:hypothetical protein
MKFKEPSKSGRLFNLLMNLPLYYRPELIPIHQHPSLIPIRADLAGAISTGMPISAYQTSGHPSTLLPVGTAPSIFDSVEVPG